MKKVLFYTDTPLLGGAEQQMLMLAKFLPSYGYEVALACANYQRLNGWCQDFLEAGANVFRCKVLHKHDPRQFFYLKTLLPNFDLMHLHVWNPASGRYGFLAASRIPLVVTEHDPFPLKGVRGWIKNKLMSRTAAIIAPSEGARQRVIAHDPRVAHKTVVVHNGIDVAAWEATAKLASRNEFRHREFGAMPGEQIVICIAELHERKGQAHLLEAMEILLRDMPNVKLVLVGDGPKRAAYAERAAALGNRVVMLGQRKDVAQLMVAADLFVLPSVREAFGLVLLEAGALGVPLVATRVGGIPEIIEDGVTGLLVRPEDPYGLAVAMREALTDSTKTTQRAEAARKRIIELFSAEEMAAKTAGVYNGIL